MWFFLALFVAGFVLTAFLSPKMKVENAKAAGLDQFTFPRAKEGDPVPRVYGTVKLPSPNTISLSGYRATGITKKVKTGLFSSKRVTTGYRYQMSVDLAFCLGPGVTFRRLWFGENLVWAGCHACATYDPISIDLPQLYGGSEDGGRGGIGGLVAFYCGKFDQPRDPWLAANMSADVPAYVGIAHMVFSDFWFGNSPNVDAVSAEVTYFVNGLGVAEGFHYMPNGYDANIVCVLYDVLSDDWGNLGYDPAKINTAQWREIAYQAREEGIGISLSVTSSTEARDAVKQMLRQLNAVIYEDTATGLVELYLMRNDYEIEDLEVLTPSEVVEVRDYTKKLWNETSNVVRLKYTDRSDNYAQDKIATAKDSSLLRFQGKERPTEIQMPGVYTAELANALAARELSNLNVPLYSCKLSVNRKGGSLRPGRPFIFQWPEYGIEQMVMRVRNIGLGTLKNGQITLSVVQDEHSLDATVIAAPVPSGYTPTELAPTDIDTFKIFELPAFLDYQAGLGTRVAHSRFASFVKAPTSYTMSYYAYIDDVPSDAEVLNQAPYSTNAKLVADLDRFEGFADGVVPVITIKEVSDPTVLIDGNNPLEAGGLMMIGDELFSYESFTDNLDDTYDLENVVRAFLDTGWFAHNADDVVWFFDGQEGFFESDTQTGDTATIYFIDRTATGLSLEADAVKTPTDAAGRIEAPVAPDYATADGSRALGQTFSPGDTVSIDARPRTRLQVATAWLEDDPAATPEAGTTYRISFEVDGVVTEVADDETLPYDLTVTGDMTGECVVLIEAKRDGFYSYAASPMPILVGGGYGEGYGLNYGGS